MLLLATPAPSSPVGARASQADTAGNWANFQVGSCRQLLFDLAQAVVCAKGISAYVKRPLCRLVSNSRDAHTNAH